MDKQITSRFLLHQLLMVAALALPSTSFAQGLFAQAANSATQVRDAYAEIYNGFYGVGKQKTLLRAALDRRPDGTPNISVDAEAHTADVTIRLFVNDPAYNAWKADARRRLDALVKSVDFSDFESSHDRVIGGKVYRFGDNEFSAIRKWEQGSGAKQAEIVVRVLFLAKDGKELWRCDLPVEKFHRSGGKAARPLYNLNRVNDLPIDRYQMNWGDEFMEGMWKEIKGAALEPKELEDAAAVIHISKMSDSFIANVEEIKCLIVDDEELVLERNRTARVKRLTDEYEAWSNRKHQDLQNAAQYRAVATTKREVLRNKIVHANPWSTNITVSLPNNESLVMIRTPGGLWFSETEITESQWAAIAAETDASTNTVSSRLLGSDKNKVAFFLEKYGVSELQLKVARRTNKELDGLLDCTVSGTQDPFGDPMFETLVAEVAGTVKKVIPIWPSDPNTTPVASIRFEDAVSFATCLNGLKPVEASELRFRLPSDEEWESACRAGSVGSVANVADVNGKNGGEGCLGELAWFNGNANGLPHSIAMKKPNAWGLYDVHGNISEWTQTEATWDGMNGEHVIVIRGGSYMDGEPACRCEQRNGMRKGTKSPVVGFRICADESDKLRMLCESAERKRCDEIEQERLAREKAETERKKREEAERIAREKAETERKKREEAERIAREKAEAERKEREEAERIAREKEEAARRAAVEAARKAYEEALQRRRDEIASQTRTVELPGGVKLEMVKTPDGLWFGKTEVTRGQWDAVMNATSGGKSSRSGLQPPLLAKFAERGIDDAKIAGLMAQNEGFAEMIGQLKATFAQLESVGATSQMLDGDEFETLLDGLESLVGGSDGDEEDEDISSETSASDYPVVNVSIVDCAKFLKTLNGLPCAKAAGLRFRLPTLSEWKKASLGGGKRPFGTTFNGDTATIRDVGWIQDDNSGFRLHQVAQRQPNAWGLCDMFGNVREFVGPVPREDDAYIRAYGGSFRTPEENLMQDDAFNDPFWYKSKADDLGFRLCAEE